MVRPKVDDILRVSIGVKKLRRLCPTRLWKSRQQLGSQKIFGEKDVVKIAAEKDEAETKRA